MTKANKGEVKIEAHHCYKCGKPFGSGGLKKTMHHAIPRFLKPDRNILVPIHEECHQEINKFNVQSIPKMKSLEGMIKNMEDFVKKYKKTISKFTDKHDAFD